MKTFLLTKLVFLIFLAIPSGAFAQARITEIMYDVEGPDTGREWIEVQNIGKSPLDLSQIRLFEAKTNHKIAAIGPSMVPVDAFAVIADAPAKFLADHPGWNGLIFDGSFSLSNEGETIALRDQSGADMDTVSFIPSWGAAGDGYSLQRSSSGAWVAALPTPGGDMSSVSAALSVAPVAVPSIGTTVLDASIDSLSSQAIANTSIATSPLSVSAGRPRLGFVGIPLRFKAIVSSGGDVSLSHSWSMGDGAAKAGENIAYAYRYPGDYTVVLNSRTRTAEAVSKASVRIVEPMLSITEANGDFIEVYNASEHEMNLGDVSIRSGNSRSFMAPDTIIPPHGSIKIPSAIAHLSGSSSVVELVDPSGAALASAGVSPNDPLISLPAGFTADIVRARIIDALSRGIQKI